MIWISFNTYLHRSSTNINEIRDPRNCKLLFNSRFAKEAGEFGEIESLGPLVCFTYGSCKPVFDIEIFVFNTSS